MRWVCATVAPWALGGGMLVSFTAVASNDVSDIGHTIRETGRIGAITASDQLITPPRVTNLRALPGSTALTAPAARKASLRFSLPDDALRTDLVRPPRFEPKDGAFEGETPELNRDNKGDPYLPLRPTLSRLGRDLENEDPHLRALSGATDMLPALERGGALPGELNLKQSFERPPQPTTTDRATAERSPLAAEQGSSGIGKAGGITPDRDGATPSVARVEAFAAMTPVTHSWNPVEVTALPVTLPAGASRFVRRYPNQPHYGALIDPGKREAEMRCLAEAIYFEARSEPELGQAAVAQVVMNRVASSLYPDSVCGVVYQNRHRHLACQFTFTCEGRALRIREPAPWRRAERIAQETISGTSFIESVGLATHYHADYVNPRWARALLRRDKIGRHIFYQLRPGQR
ncbi:MAG: Cell Wall Hydrolase [Saliniramus fredricksonii]|uniref:Cell Wall Hydrolase n=2 Tax=Saliniramus fredricksonii TaxID=1653334 RepID=A0A0P7XPA8_9HYPH|nr:cell wall hydrolase [Saliniramus fredricksonii]KPQ09340.1 MAG: Cell Wall Hydrolase [Saliniramus fredricksonii]